MKRPRKPAGMPVTLVKREDAKLFRLGEWVLVSHAEIPGPDLGKIVSHSYHKILNVDAAAGTVTYDPIPDKVFDT